MGRDSAIEWTHHTFNPWRGCTKVSAGCTHCYAETQSKRNPKVLGIWGADGTRPLGSDAYWQQPFAWDRAAREAGERHRVFCASLADVFEGRLDLEGPRERLFSVIGRTPSLDWLLLTKRPHLVRELWLRATERRPLENVWLGTSVENQQAADDRIPSLMACRDLAPVLFLSVEPLLGPVELGSAVVASGGREPDWVIVGGESGHGARPMHPDWARSLRDECYSNGIPFFFKQWGEFRTTTLEEAEADDPLIVTIKASEDADDCDKWPMTRVGKKAAGRLLDGRTWDELPIVATAEAR